jgi:integrase
MLADSGLPYIVDGRHMSESTITQYVKLTKRLLFSYRLDEPGGDTVGFALWLVDRKPAYRHATWRLYRRAAEYHLSTISAWHAVAILRSDVGKMPERGSARNKKTPRTSARKRKHIPQGDFKKLINFLRSRSKSKLGSFVADWLEAGLLTGLRPCEWAKARVGEGKLFVVSAKYAPWRSHKRHRIIDIAQFDSEQVAIVTRMAMEGEAMQEYHTYALMQRRAAATLRTACLSLWPSGSRLYCLSGMRHQCTSHCKASMTPSEVAALLGHSSSRTATRNYGRRTGAWPLDVRPPIPIPETRHDISQTNPSDAVSVLQAPYAPA